MKITKEILEAGRSSRGSYSSNQLKCLGLPGYGQLSSGWYKTLIGKEVPSEDIVRFLELRDRHVRGEASPRNNRQARNEHYAGGYIDSSKRHQGPNILPVSGLYVNTSPTREDLEACPF